MTINNLKLSKNIKKILIIGTFIITGTSVFSSCKMKDKGVSVETFENKSLISIEVQSGQTKSEIDKAVDNYNGVNTYDNLNIDSNLKVYDNVVQIINLSESDNYAKSIIDKYLDSYDYIESVTMTQTVSAYTLASQLDITVDQLNEKLPEDIKYKEEDILQEGQTYLINTQRKEEAEKIIKDDIKLDNLVNKNIYFEKAKQIESNDEQILNELTVAKINDMQTIKTINEDTDFNTLLYQMGSDDENINDNRSQLIISNDEYNYDSTIKKGSILIIPNKVLNNLNNDNNYKINK